MKNSYKVYITIGVLITLSVTIYWILKPAATPWVEDGNLSLIVRAVPGKTENVQFGIGIDNMELYKKDGGTERVTVLTRRVLLTPGEDDLTLVLDTNVPTGEYIGFGFTLTSPEIRNAWEQDTPPEHVSLIQDMIRLDVPYTVQADLQSAILLSFETVQAIHTRDAERVYLPVIQIETRRGASTYEEETTGEIIVQGGVIENSATFGMDWEGRVRFNYRQRQLPVVKEEETNPQTQELKEEVVPDELSSTTATTTATSTLTEPEHSTTTNEEI